MGSFCEFVCRFAISVEFEVISTDELDNESGYHLTLLTTEGKESATIIFAERYQVHFRDAIFFLTQRDIRRMMGTQGE